MLFNFACLFGAAVLAGALNSVAGGGSFITFPTLLFTGVPAIAANATNTVALWPGTIASVGAYRQELATQRRPLLLLGSTSLIGGLFGAILLLHTPQETFRRLIPYLLLVATLLLIFGGQISKRLKNHFSIHKAHLPGTESNDFKVLLGVSLLQLLIATYGGFFGGGIGILMLASLTLLGMENIHTLNAFKTLLASLINGVAVITFVLAGVVQWPQATLMIVGAIIGGYGGAFYARKLDPALVRRFVIGIALAMTLFFFIHG